MSRRLRFAAALLCLGVACWASLAGAQQPAEFASKARNAILMDYESGSILYQKAADELVAPASMSKLVTLAVVFRALKDGKITPETEFKTTEYAWRNGGAPSGTSAMFIPINTSTPVRDLVAGLIVQSANDAALTLAEGIAGNVAGFVKLMGEEARRIGLAKSTFANPTGLSDPGQLMTARELALLARFLVREYPEQYKLFGQKDFQFRKYRFLNRNPLLGVEPGVDGLKTGHTKDAGYGMVVSTVVDGRRLIGVVMGLQNEKERKEEAKRLLDWGARGVSTALLFDAGETVGTARVWGGSRVYLPLVGQGPLTAVLPKYPPNQKLRGEIVYNGPLKPPIKKGDQVAALRVTSTLPGTSEPLATSEIPLYAAEDVEPSGFAWRGLDALLYLALRAVKL